MRVIMSNAYTNIIEEHLTPEELKSGVMVDVGANDGEFLSWSLQFEKQGYRVLCIEGNPAYEELLRTCRKEVMIEVISKKDGEEVTFYVYKNGPDSLKFASYSGIIPHMSGYCDTFKTVTKTLTSCLKERKIEKVTILGIDVEGNEFNVLLGLNFNQWKPKIIFCEKHFNLDSPLQEEFLANLGYRMVGIISYDQIWILGEI